MKNRTAYVLTLALCLFGFGHAIPAQAPAAAQQSTTQAPPRSSTTHHRTTHTTTAAPANSQAPTTAPQTTTTTLSNDNHYVNSDGHVVHSPARSSNGVPAGATAQCGDGSYSFSQHRQGTCSHHGGVSRWL